MARQCAVAALAVSAAVFLAGAARAESPLIIDHTSAHSHQELHALGEAAVNRAKDDLHVAYGHTSHGSQIITGMTLLDAFMHSKHGTPTGLYAWHDGPQAGALDIDDYFVAGDLGNPDYVTWAARTRTYLDNPANSDVNVVIWSWCGQADTTEANINTYLGLMTALENDYSGVTFVYMTGHLDGTGATGNLNLRNQQIRDYCTANNKVLYDFADIESWDPDKAVHYMPLLCNDYCAYDSDDNGTRDRNWATDWQNAHPGEWYTCSAAHSQPLNGNVKAYAAWALWAAIAERRSGLTIEKWECLVDHGAAGELATPVADDTVEPRTSGVTKLRVTFSKPIDPTTLMPAIGAVTISGRVTGSQTGLIAALSLDPTGTVLTIGLSSPLPDGDSYGVAITEQVTTPDGTPVEGDRNVSLTARAGDVNASGQVSAADILAVRSAAGQAVTPASAGLDVDCSGAINGSDLMAVRRRVDAP